MPQQYLRDIADIMAERRVKDDADEGNYLKYAWARPRSDGDIANWGKLNQASGLVAPPAPQPSIAPSQP